MSYLCTDNIYALSVLSKQMDRKMKVSIEQRDLFGAKGTVISPLNYIGGKRKLLPQILPLFPTKISTFIDLFCGGCTVGLNVDAEKVVFNDNLTYLIDMYQAFLHTNKEDVLSYIETRVKDLKLTQTNIEGYLKLRAEYNSVRNPLDLFVLIAYSFNHQIRFNSSHEYNNPFGKERSSYNSKMQDNLRSFLDAIHSRNVSFSNLDFREVDFSVLSDNDFVYADPPYLITRGTYNDGKRGFSGWGTSEEIALLELLKSLDSKGVRFALSNVLTHKGEENKLLQEWISGHGFSVHWLNMCYNNSNYQSAASKGKTLEILVTNYTNN